MVCCIDPPHDLAKYQMHAEMKGEALQVAILIGAPPPVFLAAVASLPIDQDELQLAAHINGGSMEMCRCETLDLLVPSATEIVLMLRNLNDAITFDSMEIAREQISVWVEGYQRDIAVRVAAE